MMTTEKAPKWGVNDLKRRLHKSDLEHDGPVVWGTREDVMAQSGARGRLFLVLCARLAPYRSQEASGHLTRPSCSSSSAA